MGKNEYQKLQANPGFFCSVNEGCFVLVPRYFLNNCGLENQVHVESIAVFQQCVDLIFQMGAYRLAHGLWHLNSHSRELQCKT